MSYLARSRPLRRLNVCIIFTHWRLTRTIFGDVFKLTFSNLSLCLSCARNCLGYRISSLCPLGMNVNIFSAAATKPSILQLFSRFALRLVVALLIQVVVSDVGWFVHHTHMAAIVRPSCGGRPGQTNINEEDDAGRRRDIDNDDDYGKLLLLALWLLLSCAAPSIQTNQAPNPGELRGFRFTVCVPCSFFVFFFHYWMKCGETGRCRLNRKTKNVMEKKETCHMDVVVGSTGELWNLRHVWDWIG